MGGKKMKTTDTLTMGHCSLGFASRGWPCQDSAYTCKLSELPTGTSQRPSPLCNSKGSTQITRYLFLRNNIQIRFLLRKLLRNIPYKHREFLSSEISNHIQLMVSSQKPSQDNISLAVLEGSSHGTAPKLPPIF